MASIADDKAIIKELTEGSGDIHSLTAYMSYKEIPRDTPIKDIKKKYHHLRQEAKGIEFAINKIFIFNYKMCLDSCVYGILLVPLQLTNCIRYEK